MRRIETGVVQFGDDWPGVFIRGDHALMDFAPAVALVMKELEPSAPHLAYYLSSIHELLMSCNADSAKDVQVVSFGADSEVEAIDPDDAALVVAFMEMHTGVPFGDMIGRSDKDRILQAAALAIDTKES